MMLSGWGHFPRHDCTVARPRDETDLRALLGEGPLIARGNGRGYGDCALGSGTTVDMRRFDRMLAFDADTGQLIAEAGVLLGDIIAAFLPRGWFPAVTPGTKFVTVGGMIAADVHGKNHHRDGGFGVFVDWIDLLGSDGAVLRCSRTENADLFAWTIGGMGLTGVILRAAFRLRRVDSGWIRQTGIAAPNLDAAMALFDAHEGASYSVAWIDCLAKGAHLGRSVITLGEHAAIDDLPDARRADPFVIPARCAPGVPFALPVTPLNSLTVRGFNAAYWRANVARQGRRLVGWDSYFYPLDAIADWNRIYGRRGFAQFQCAIPLAQARAGLTKLLEAIEQSGQGSFLAVLKRLGASAGPFSFPMEGYTLALDFPVSRASLDLMTRLDRIVIDYGGRFYLAKDSRMTAETLRASDPRVADFTAMRTPSAAAFQSLQSQRLAL